MSNRTHPAICDVVSFTSMENDKYMNGVFMNESSTSVLILALIALSCLHAIYHDEYITMKGNVLQFIALLETTSV